MDYYRGKLRVGATVFRICFLMLTGGKMILAVMVTLLMLTTIAMKRFWPHWLLLTPSFADRLHLNPANPTGKYYQQENQIHRPAADNLVALWCYRHCVAEE